MDPSYLGGWKTNKYEMMGEPKPHGNVAVSWQWRQLGLTPKGSMSNSRILQEAAEDHLVKKKHFTERCCEVPGIPRSAFLMVFSPDGTKVASTHGNHDVYVSELSTGKHVQTLSGHPRTPWCVAFHPSHAQLLGSGCLGGQVRVWDLNGGSEVWTVGSETVIASIAFHPRDRLLVIATYNELYFWDWSQPQPFTKVQTNTIREKVRFVSFDPLGHKLITGVSVCAAVTAEPPLLSAQPGAPEPPHGPGSSHDQITTYHQLLQRYDSLVRNYHRLFLARSQFTSTTDRGTDPMEVDWSAGQASTSAGPGRPAATPPGPPHAPHPRPRSDSDTDDAPTAPISPVYNNNPWNSSRRPLEVVFSSNRSIVLDARERLFGSGALGSRQSAFQPFPERPQTSAPPNPSPSSTARLPNPFHPNNSSADPAEINVISEDLSFAFWDPPSTGLSPPPTDPPTATNHTDLSTEQNSTNPIDLLHSSTGSDRSASTDRRSPATDRNPEAAPYRFRNELTASLTRLQGFMENSIDETLNFWETYNSRIPVTSATDAGALSRLLDDRPEPPRVAPPRSRENPLRAGSRAAGPFIVNCRYANSRDDAVPGVPAPGPNFPSQRRRQDELRSASSTSPPVDVDISDVGRIEGPVERDVLDTLRVMLRDSGNRLVNLITDRPETGNDTVEDWMMRVSGRDPYPSLNLIPPMARDVGYLSAVSVRNRLFSSDDGSDSDREMFSPLPLHIYRTRNSNAPPFQRLRSDPMELETIATGDQPNSSRTERTSGFNELTSSLINLHNEYINSTCRPSNAESERRARPRVEDEARLEETPSTSRRREPSDAPPDRDPSVGDAFGRVTRGVEAIQRHTEALRALWSDTGSTPPLRQLRRMWEDLRREIVALNRPSGTTSNPTGFFSLPPRERLNILMAQHRARRHRTFPGEGSSRTDGATSGPDHENDDPGGSGDDDARPSAFTHESSDTNPDVPSTSSGITHEGGANRTDHPKTYPPSSKLKVNLVSFPRQRDPTQTMRRRLRSIVLNRLIRDRFPSWRAQRRAGRAGPGLPRRQELQLTREIMRLHARRVLSIMFGTMVHCLEADQLGNRIVAMLRALKKALGVTCLLLVSYPYPGHPRRPAPSAPREDEPVATTSAAWAAPGEASGEPATTEATETSPSGTARPSWSHRVAVQISAANRNDSSNARRRRDAYHKIRKSRSMPSNSAPRSLAFKRESPVPRDVQSRAPPRRFRESPVPSTSALQPQQPPTRIRIQSDLPDDDSPSAASSSVGRAFASWSNRMLSLSRRIHSRMLIRRYLINHGFVRDITGVFRRPDNRRNASSPSAAVRGFRLSNRPRIFSVSGSAALPGEAGGGPDALVSSVVVPTVHVNDVPVSDMQPGAEGAPPPVVRSRERSRLMPEFFQPNLRQGLMSVEELTGGLLEVGPSYLSETPASPVHRIQVWDFSNGQIPDISNATHNIVVHKCKIHNDASIDISKDGRLLVALLPAQRLRHITHRLGIYSLEWGALGDCLYTTLLEQNAVSVSLSPCSMHLAVGLGSRRVSLQPTGRNGTMALIFRLGTIVQSELAKQRGGILILTRSLEQSWDLGVTSLNCLRWAPQPGQGLVYANNTGQLKILS